MTIPGFSQLDSVVAYLAGAIGKPDDQIRLMLCMYLGYPLGVILNRGVSSPFLRHLFAVVTGFILQVYMYRAQFYHTLVMTFITYAIMKFAPRNQQTSLVFVWVMSYLSFQHIYRMWANFGGYDMDITTYSMILTAKLSSLAFCYRDGGQKDENLLPEQIERKVAKMPTILELLSYVYFPCSAICGPFFEFSDYKLFIERKDRYANIPSTFKQSMMKFLQGKMCLALHIFIASYCYPAFCGTEEFAKQSFIYKVVYFFLAMTGQRFVYYATWCITDGQIMASGLGYAGKDKKTGEDRFDRIYSIIILDVELGLSPQIMMQHWNHQIHLWLKYYIYNRTLIPGKKPGLRNNLATFITSAFWHGFYPFYYVMFFASAVLGELSKDIYRSRIYFRFIPYPISSILANFLSMLTMNFMGISFMLLTFEKGFRFSQSVHHFVYIYVFVFFAIFRFSGITRKAAKLEARLKEKAAAKEKPLAEIDTKKEK